jgi:hypothetical protein
MGILAEWPCNFCCFVTIRTLDRDVGGWAILFRVKRHAPMPFMVVFSDPMPAIPEHVRERLLSSLEEVGATLSSIPGENPVWESLKTAPMLLTVEGWRFVYAVDRQRGRITVKEFRAPIP